MRVGEIEITPLSDGVLQIPPTEILSKSIEAWQAHRELLDGRGLLGVNFGGFLVRTPRRTIVIDTGIGGGAAPGLGIGTFPANLRRAGVAASDVSDVIFTHLHFDHIGWSTDGSRPLFPAAAHHCHVLDWEYFCGVQPAVETGPGIEEFGALPAPVRLAPLADRITLFNDEHEITTGVRVRFAPGHTPGHCVVELRSGGACAILLADAAHNPVELLEDDWASPTDVDPDCAQRTRAALARELISSGTPATMTHYEGNRFGRLVSSGDGRRWMPA